MVHELLHRGPVHVFEIGAADALCLVHRACAQGDVELHIVIVSLRLPQIGQPHRTPRRAFNADAPPPPRAGPWPAHRPRAAPLPTRGLIELPKALAGNGPSGTYSHCWISRALQSL